MTFCYGSFSFEAYSRSTIETYVKVNELNICFDIGKCPMELIAVPQVFMSHFHVDHSLGLSYYIAHRNLAKLTPGQIYVPAAAEKQVHAMIQAHAQLEQARRKYDLIPVETGMRIAFKPKLTMRMFATDHKIPSMGYQVLETRQKLRPELVSMPQAELLALKQRGIEIVNKVEIPRLAYVGDSSIQVFDWHPEILNSEVLLTECTFLAPEHYAEAKARKHIHLQDLLPYLEQSHSQHIVLMHFSMRYQRHEIEHYVKALIPPHQRHKIHLLL